MDESKQTVKAALAALDESQRRPPLPHESAALVPLYWSIAHTAGRADEAAASAATERAGQLLQGGARPGGPGGGSRDGPPDGPRGGARNEPPDRDPDPDGEPTPGRGRP